VAPTLHSLLLGPLRCPDQEPRGITALAQLQNNKRLLLLHEFIDVLLLFGGTFQVSFLWYESVVLAKQIKENILM
jgi:hypothetical protein